MSTQPNDTTTKIALPALVAILNLHGIEMNATEDDFGYHGEMVITKVGLNIPQLIADLKGQGDPLIKKMGEKLENYIYPSDYNTANSLVSALTMACSDILCWDSTSEHPNPHNQQMVEFCEYFEGNMIDTYAMPLSKYFSANEEIDEDELDNIAYENMRENLDFGWRANDFEDLTPESEVVFYINTKDKPYEAYYIAENFGFGDVSQQQFEEKLDSEAREWRNINMDCAWELKPRFTCLVDC